jgi:hypothetical protein
MLKRSHLPRQILPDADPRFPNETEGKCVTVFPIDYVYQTRDTPICTGDRVEFEVVSGNRPDKPGRVKAASVIKLSDISGNPPSTVGIWSRIAREIVERDEQGSPSSSSSGAATPDAVPEVEDVDMDADSVDFEGDTEERDYEAEVQRAENEADAWAAQWAEYEAELEYDEYYRQRGARRVRNGW